MQQPTYYQNPVETWDEKKCAKMAKQRPKDGWGTPHPYKGAVPGLQAGPVRYNGGCIRPYNGGDWFPGEEFHLPKLAPGYSFHFIPTWCWVIKKDKKEK